MGNSSYQFREGRARRFVYAVLWFLILGSGAWCQELDDASEAWAYMSVIFGNDAGVYANMDTSDVGLYALNLGLRAVAEDIGFQVQTSIRIEQDSFLYPLPHTFRPSIEEMDEVEQNLHVYYRSVGHQTYYGLAHGSPQEVYTGDGAMIVPWRWNLEDSMLHIAPTNAEGDTLVVTGLGRITPVSHGASSLSPVPEDLRPAVCWYAIAALTINTNPELYIRALTEFDRFKPASPITPIRQ